MRPKKMHFHHVIAYNIHGKTSRGNPASYKFTLECGHYKYEFHNARSSIMACLLSTILTEITKMGKLKVEDFPRMHCHACATGKPHDPKEETDLQKLVNDINEAVKKAQKPTPS